MRLAHEISGPDDAAQIVLIHGITESRHTWRPIIEALAADHRVLAVDLRGHGESPKGDAYDPISYATDVAETAAAEGFDRAIVVGHSLGGVVATACALVMPLVAVVNVDQPLLLSGFKDGLSQLEPMLKGSPAEFLAARDMMFGAMDGPLPAAERSRFMAHAHPEQDVVLGTWATVFESTAAELDETVGQLAGGVTVPYLSLHGIDPGPEYAAWLTGLVPTAIVEVWPEHGHYPHLVDLPRFLARLGEFEHRVRA